MSHNHRRQNPEIARLEHTAQFVAKTTTLDLDLFLDYSPEQRAAMWRQWDNVAKHQAVVLMLKRRFGDWSEAGVAHWIAEYDRRWEAA